MAIAPFHFKLKKISGSEQRVLSALFDFLPKTGMREKFHDAVIEALSKHLGIDTDYRLETVNQGHFNSFVERLPDSALILVLGMAPREGRIVIEIDDQLAALFVEKLLGGQGESFPTPKPLSDTEQGVLQYLILQVLSHIYRLCGNDSRLHFRFEKFLLSPKGLKGTVSADEDVLEMAVRVSCGKLDGFVRLYFPSPLIQQQYLNIESKGEVREAERAYLLKHLTEFGFINVPLWAEAGSTTVSADDLKNLEAGDVILLDSTELVLTNTGPAGRVTLRTGEGRHGGFISEMEASPRKIKCRIVDVRKGEDIF